ncbi:MAG: HEPN domain-containing protein [Bacteroidales bacterium]
MDEKSKYWLELSDYDLETAFAMLDSKRYLYVGYMCHQTIEKIFKAYFTALWSETAPYSHSLSYLVAARKLHFLRYACLKTRHLRLVNSSFSDFASLENEVFLLATGKKT